MDTSASSVERYASVIAGQLGCWDRVIITGILPDVCHPAALERQLHQSGIRCFDLADFALPLRERIRDHTARQASDAGLHIEFIERRNFRKEDRVTEILARRGTHPGLVHVFSAMENCTTFRSWHDKATGRRGVKAIGGKCLLFFFYRALPDSVAWSALSACAP